MKYIQHTAYNPCKFIIKKKAFDIHNSGNLKPLYSFSSKEQHSPVKNELKKVKSQDKISKVSH